MTAREIPAALRLCRASHWNQSEADWQMFLRMSPEGCHVAEKNGTVVGTVATIRYGDRFSWLSMILVDPCERGNGIGTQLVHKGLSALSKEKCVRLDATPTGRRIYSRHGFVDEYPLCRMTGVIDSIGLSSICSSTRRACLRDLDEIAARDFEIFGADRMCLIRDLFRRAPEYAWVLEKAGRICGYLLGRSGFLYEHLGPVIAEDDAGARSLVAKCIQANPGKSFAVDAQGFTPGWIEWLTATGFRQERTFVRMYRGENRYPGLPKHQFAVAGPEFG